MDTLISRVEAPVSRLDDKLENLWKFGPIYKQHKKVFRWIGAGISAYCGLKVASWLLTQAFKLPPVDLNKRYGKGSWAVVTKASSPVGKAFCHALAQKGFNIALIGKNDNKLQEIALEVSNAQNGKIETRVIVADFGECIKEGFFETIYMQLQDLDVSVLVNNFIVDIGKQRLVETSEAQLKYMIMANTVPTALMIRTLVGRLRARTEQSKVKSAIITLSSHAVSTPLPYRAAYGSTSIFNDYISRGLAIEYAGQNIDWLSYRVPLKSKKDYKGAPMRSADCVRACLASLGKEHYTNGSLKYSFQAQKLSLPWLFPGEIQIDEKNDSGFEMQRQLGSSR